MATPYKDNNNYSIVLPSNNLFRITSSKSEDLLEVFWTETASPAVSLEGETVFLLPKSRQGKLTNEVQIELSKVIFPKGNI
jgi:hypothetical protein